MEPGAWRLDDHFARFSCGALRGEVDLAKPCRGVQALKISGAHLLQFHILAVASPGDAAATMGEPRESYARGGDLVLKFAETVDRPTRIEVYWRLASNFGDGVEAAVGVDLQISVETPAAESDPELAAASEISASELVVPRENSTSNIAAHRPKQGESWVFQPTDHGGCLVFRPRGQPWTYAEMIHPEDFRQDILEQTDDAWRLRHRLFAPPLEKGVILRSRVRGVFVPRADDLQMVERIHREFCSAAPPLTT